MIALACVVALALQDVPAKGGAELVHTEADPRYFVETVSPDAARTALGRGVKFLIDKQNADGSWGTSTPESLYELNYSNASFYAWKVAGGALCVQTLLMVEETPERRRALDNAVDYILEHEKPLRGNHWDIDNNWAALCVFSMLVDVAQDPRFQSEKWKPRIAARAKEYAEHLAANQDPFGGWGYYEGPVLSRRPTWSTSFATALVVPALVTARTELKWPVDEPMSKRAITYVQNCALPNGAYDYSFSPIPRLAGGEEINDVKGSLSRIQVCNWARRRAGDPKVTDEKLREGLKLFFEHHRFLAVARVTEEFTATQRGVLAVVGARKLLAADPALGRSIERRSPYVDVLSYLQLELLRRKREGRVAAGERERVDAAIQPTINGIAAGLRNTG